MDNLASFFNNDDEETINENTEEQTEETTNTEVEDIDKEEEIEDIEEEKEKEEENTENFYPDLSKLLGIELNEDTEYSNDLEGAAEYIKYVVEQNINKYEEDLKQHDLAYKALELSRNGGNPYDLFKNTEQITEIDENNKIQQRTFIEKYLLGKGLDSNTANIIIERAEEDDKLLDTAKGYLELFKKDNEAKQQQILEETKQAKLEQLNKDKSFVSNIQNVIESGNIEVNSKIFKIPAKEKEEFMSHIKNGLQYNGKGGYQIAIDIDDKNTINEVLQALYFNFKKGDLTSLVNRRANTKFINNRTKSKKDSSDKDDVLSQFFNN